MRKRATLSCSHISSPTWVFLFWPLFIEQPSGAASVSPCSILIFWGTRVFQFLPLLASRSRSRLASPHQSLCAQWPCPARPKPLLFQGNRYKHIDSFPPRPFLLNPTIFFHRPLDLPSPLQVSQDSYAALHPAPSLSSPFRIFLQLLRASPSRVVFVTVVFDPTVLNISRLWVFSVLCQPAQPLTHPAGEGCLGISWMPVCLLPSFSCSAFFFFLSLRPNFTLFFLLLAAFHPFFAPIYCFHLPPPFLFFCCPYIKFPFSHTKKAKLCAISMGVDFYFSSVQHSLFGYFLFFFFRFLSAASPPFLLFFSRIKLD